MKLIEHKVNGWNDKIPNYQKAKYPQPLDENLPRHYNVSIFCGARGSGKTTMCVKYLYELEKRGIEGGIPPRVVLISPTAKSDSNKMFELIKSIDEDDVIENYSDGALKEKMNELRTDLDEATDYRNYKKVYQRFEKAKNMNGFTIDDLILLKKYNFEHWTKIPEPKYPNGFMTFLLVDDCACTDIFKNGKSYFTNIVIKNRHSSEINIPMNILICVQQIFNIPKTIRLNANLICLFKFGNKKVILDDLYTLVSAWTTPEEFDKIYTHCTEEPHSCLIIDLTKGKPLFKKNWSTNVELTTEHKEINNISS